MKIKKGCTRLVFLIGKYAIKIPNFTYGLPFFLKGWLTNIEEETKWRVFNCEGMEDPSIKYLLCPIRKKLLGGFILVMDRAEQLPWDDNFIPDKRMLQVCGDHKSDNYGLLNGKIVCFDYGQN